MMMMMGGGGFAIAFPLPDGARYPSACADIHLLYDPTMEQTSYETEELGMMWYYDNSLGAP